MEAFSCHVMIPHPFSLEMSVAEIIVVVLPTKIICEMLDDALEK